MIFQSIRDLKKFDSSIDVVAVKSILDGPFFSFEVNDGSVQGAGAATNAAGALTKALSEFAERHVVKNFASQLGVLTSSGFAAHVDEDSAKRAAASELIERDAFMVCWFAQILPVWLAPNQISVDKSFRDLLLSLDIAGIRFKVGLLAKSGGYFVSVGMLDFRECTTHRAAYGFVTEADDSFMGAICKVILSLCRISNLILTRKTVGGELFSQVDVFEVKRPHEHLEYYLNPINRSALQPWWESRSSQVLSLESPDITFQVLNHPIADLLQRKVIFSNSTSLLSYFCGTSIDFELVEKRLKVLGFSINIDRSILHPLS
jgi:hypothetical protein